MYHRKIDDLPEWYVVRTKPNGLATAHQHLKRQGMATLMPELDVTSRTSRGWRKSRRPLFPGYLFLTSHTGDVPWSSVRNTRGVAQVISVGGRPARLPKGYAEELQMVVGDQNMVDPGRLEQGDEVRVINGPMSGWIGKVLAADEDGRLQLLVEVMGRSVKTHTTRESVERAG